ncbi:MAG: ribosome biogenesis GTP-binding protein YihA/YsxC [Thermodesulfobacteriota bacterium]|nr:ribosome biogenesis GTP-binding protein YihA/YsxC [Thermodesulfobacteriota bacterium]
MNPTLTLEKTVYALDQLEEIRAPQTALAGRSNVGKSSLINCLAGQKKLARISSTPGKTRSLNFYRVQPDDFYLVDLPGYGYARYSKAERIKWGKLIETYIHPNPWLRAVAVLLDCRLDPQKSDLELISYLNSLDIEIIAVLTKADKCKQNEQAARARQWRNILSRGGSPLLFSSKTGKGRDALWELLRKVALKI